MGVGRSTVFELLRSGQLASISVMRRRLIARVSIEKFINDRLHNCAATGSTPDAALREGTSSHAASPS